MRFRVLQSCPGHLRAKYRVALTTALEAVHEAAQRRDPVKEFRAWNLFSLLPFWLLRKPLGQGRVRKAELSDRFELFTGGQWESLHGAATRDTIRNRELRAPSEPTPEQRVVRKCDLGKFREPVSV